MDGFMHSHISEFSLSLLSGDSAELWNQEKETFSFASNYPDYFAGGGIPSQEMQEKEPDWETYNLIPTEKGKTVCHNLIKPEALRTCYPPILNYTIHEAITAIRNGKISRAAKFAGILSHLIGDTGQAAHLMDERIIKLLFPQKKICYMIHGFIEGFATGKIPAHMHTPRLLGYSEEELVWRMTEELQKLKNEETGALVPTLQALLAEDSERSSECAGQTAGHCADLVSDLLFSLFAISGQKFPEQSEQISLCDLEHGDCDCDMMFNKDVMIDHMPRKKWKNDEWKNPLPFDLGNGTERGLCLLPLMAPGVPVIRDAYVEYFLPPEGFRFFSANLGLNRLTDNGTGIIFRVQLDGATVYESPAVTKETPPIPVRIKLNGAKILRLYVRDMREPPCKTEFVYPVFGTPLLER